MNYKDKNIIMIDWWPSKQNTYMACNPITYIN